MKRVLTTLVFSAFLCFSVNAQLPNGSVAPNWTGIDLNGNTWTLYDILSQGKYVMMDLSATWCGPCWDFHQSGKAEQLWNLYGPDGTDEMVIFTIEGDERTNIDCIYNLPGCNNSTWGNWTTGVTYPFINDDIIADLYEINAWPTLFFICPNLQLREISTSSSVAQIYNMMGSCPQPSGVNNAGVVLYESFEGAFCENVQFLPKAKLQNLGTGDITSMSVELLVNGTVVETINWTGNLKTYELIDIEFSELNVTESSNLEIKVSMVNGGTDDATENDTYTAAIVPSPVTADNYISLEFKTDDYPEESYWELRDANENALYTGGNIGIFGDPAFIHEDTYPENRTIYTHQLPVPADGCYSFTVYDIFGDGIQEFGGYFRVKDSAGNIIQAGGDFGSIDQRLFQVEGSAMAIMDNAALVLSQGIDARLCVSEMVSPSVLIQNLGANEITEVVLDASNSTEVLSTKTWTGSLATGGYANVQFDMFEVNYEDPVQNYSIVSVNGAADMYDFKNTIQRALDFPQTTTEDQMLTVEIQTDQFGYETYWEITDYAGVVIASGGNADVGPDGGGQQVATPNGPGAYGANASFTHEVVFPGDVSDCYDFLIVDDWGDGFIDQNSIQRGSFTLKEQDGTILFTGSPNTFSALRGSFTVEATEAVPITLLSFQAFLVKDKVKLEWKSTSEINNYGFEVFHSTDTEKWNKIGFVASASRSNDVNYYQLRHDRPSKGTNYYRLKQIDRDGRFEFSNIEIVDFDKGLSNAGIRIYPTITSDQVSIETSLLNQAPIHIQVINMNYQVVYDRIWSENNGEIELNFSDYTSGMYTVRISQDNLQYMGRVVKQ
jgi:hypothetical protein